MLGAPQEVIDQVRVEENPVIDVYQENQKAVEWTLIVIEQNFLIWTNGVCLGINAAAIGADKKLRKLKATADDYQRMLIAVGAFIKKVNSKDSNHA